MRSRVILSRVLFLLYLVAIAFLLFATADSLPTISRTIWGLPTDKVAHFIMFLPFPILAFLSCDITTKKAWHSILLVLSLLVAGCVVALLTEYFQGLTGYRTSDIEDFKMDAIALSISSLFVLVVDVTKLPKSKKK